MYEILVLFLGYLSYVCTWYQVLGTKYFGISAAEGGESPPPWLMTEAAAAGGEPP